MVPRFKGVAFIEPYTSGGAISEGDCVRIDKDLGKVVSCVAGETKPAIGWALNSVSAANKTVYVRLASPSTWAYMPLENAFADTQLGVHYALVGASGAHKVDNDNVAADFFRIEARPDGADTQYAWVSIIALGEAVS